VAEFYAADKDPLVKQLSAGLLRAGE